MDLARELKKILIMNVTVIPIVLGAVGTVTKGFVKRRGHGNKRTNGDNPNYRIIDVGQNTEKSPRNFKL